METEKTPPTLQLEYAGPRTGIHRGNESNWPTAVYVVALVIAFVTMAYWNAATSAYDDEIRASLRTQLALLLCATLRLIYARRRRERNKGWIFYVAILVLAAPIWAVIAPPLARFGLWLWHGPIFD